MGKASRDKGARNKYGAKKTEIDGIVFASKAEGKRYWELNLLRLSGQITGLVLQPKFSLVVNGVKVGTYTPDFSYHENGKYIAEDTKGGYRREAFALRAKLFQATHPDIELRINGIAAKRPKSVALDAQITPEPEWVLRKAVP